MNAYISSDINMVKELDPKRHELALLQADWLEKGGTIEVLPFWVQRDEPRKPNTITPNFQSSAVKEETNLQAARIRQLAETLNGEEICEKEGISRGVLRGITKRYSITLKVGPRPIKAHNRIKPDKEAALVERIKECRAAGMSCNQCCKALTISYSMLDRLISEHHLDFPKLTPAFR